MVYADASFLVSIYLPETQTAQARSEAARIKEPLAFSPFLRLEVRNAFNFAVARDRITAAQRDVLWLRIEQQRRDGFFTDVELSHPELYAKAMQLSDRHTPTLATCTLDLLHVAAALLLGAREFYSFDERQRRAAVAERLKVRP